MNSNPTDKECVRRVLKGDPESFSLLVRRYSPRMLNLALGIVGGRQAAEDVVQDALVKAYEKLHTWRNDSSLSTWLYRIVYTTAISSLRARKVNFSSPDALAGVPDEDDGGREEWEINEQNIARMRRALEMLPPLDRTLINLFYIEDKPVREIGLICAESQSNVKTRLHRARKRLGILMNEMRLER